MMHRQGLRAQAYAPEATTPDAYTPDAFTPDAFTPDAFTPDAFTPEEPHRLSAREPFGALNCGRRVLDALGQKTNSHPIHQANHHLPK